MAWSRASQRLLLKINLMSELPVKALSPARNKLNPTFVRREVGNCQIVGTDASMTPVLLETLQLQSVHADSKGSPVGWLHGA